MMQTIGLCLQRSAAGRGSYLKKHGVFAAMGENVRYQPRKVPLYPELIKIGSNVNISSNVSLMVHDAIHLVHNKLPGVEKKLPEKVGCIEIGDNVFIGARTIILGNVRIGSNVIVSAGAFVNKDLESGGIYGGSPARRIGDFDEFWRKRETQGYPSVKRNQQIDPEEIRTAWEQFEALRR